MLSAAIYRASSHAGSRRCFHASPLAWAKLNVQGLAEKVNLEGKNVLVRVDLNVPLAKASVSKQMKYLLCVWMVTIDFKQLGSSVLLRQNKQQCLPLFLFLFSFLFLLPRHLL